MLLFPGLKAQKPMEKVDLATMTFVRQNFTRNFYSDHKVISELNMEGSDLKLENAANLNILSSGVLPAISQEGRQLVWEALDGKAAWAIVRVGSFHPYLCYETTFETAQGSETGISFFSDEVDDSGAPKNQIQIIYKDGTVLSRILEAGKVQELEKAQVGQLRKVRLRVQYTGLRLHVFLVKDSGETPLLFDSEKDMRAVDVMVRYSWGAFASLPGGGRATLLQARSMLSTGTGQADPQIIQTKSGKPLVKDGRLYLCLSTRGFERIIDTFQGVYSLGLEGYDLKLEGALFFTKQDDVMYGFHATKVVWDEDEGQFLVITTTHEDTHTLAWAKTRTDILHGIHLLNVTELDFPHAQSRMPGANAEDPDFFYDAKAKKWRLSYCALHEGSYVTFLCQSKTWNGAYQLLAQSKENNNTGIRQVDVGGKRYVLSGGSGTTFYIYDYPTLENLGTFRQRYPNGGFRGWPTIVPVDYGNYERYLWITFDRGAQTGRYSYGTLYFYLSDQMWKKEQ